MATGDKWCCITFIQGGDAWDEFERVLAEDGERAALAHLRQWDYGPESEHEAVDGEPELMHRSLDADGYILTYDEAYSTAALYRRAGADVREADPGRLAAWERGRGHEAGCPACGSPRTAMDASWLDQFGHAGCVVAVEWRCEDCGALWREDRLHDYVRSEVKLQGRRG